MEDMYFLIKDNKVKDIISGFYEIDGFVTINAKGWDKVNYNDIYENGIFYNNETLDPIIFINHDIIEYIPTLEEKNRADIDYISIMLGVDL